MTIKPSKLTEEEILLAFAVEPTHDQMTLERYLSDYPEHAEALIDCSIEIMVDAARSHEAVVSSESNIDKAWHRFQEAVRPPIKKSIANPFAKLDPTGFRSIADKLNINNLLLIRLRDRAIDATTIPLRFIQSLSSELGTTTDAVMTYLSAPPSIVSDQSFRSEVKPAVKAQISFEDAIKTSQLTKPQQEALRELDV